MTTVVSEDTILQGFIRDCRLRGMTEESIRKYMSAIRMFLSFLKDRGSNILSVDTIVLRDFLEYLMFKRGARFKTIDNYFSALSTFYDYLVFEGLATSNIILPFRKRYLRRYKNETRVERKLLSIEEMSMLINSILDPRDKAIVTLLAKTGIRRGELIRIDVDDIDWKEYSIRLKPTAKRSNRLIFFDEEAAVILRRWLTVREKLRPKTKALFVSYQTLGRLDRNGVYNVVLKYAIKLGFHDPDSPNIEDRLTPHCFRHWFTTWLLRRGMPREHVKELRGDKRREAIDIYHHIDKEELRRSYLAYIPRLGII